MKMKNYMAGILLILFIAWPFVHRTLAEIYHINPWKYYGWAMYLVPAPAANIKVYGKYGEQWLKLKREPQLNKRIDVFLKKLANRGRLAKPDQLAKLLFNFDNSPEELRFVLIHKRYDWNAHKYIKTKRKEFYKKP